MELKKFIIKLILFLLPLIFFWLLIEIYLLNKPLQNTYTAKKYYLNLKKESITTLILGNSHELNAINPAFLSTEAFNLANASQTLYYDSALLQNYLPQLPKLKTVIIGISYFSFFYELSDISEHWRQQFYYQTYDIKPLSLKFFELNNYSKLSLYGFSKTFNLLKQKGISQDCQNLLPNGFLYKSTNETINDSLGKKRVELHHKQRFISQTQKIKNRVLHLVQFLKSKNIKVVFVTTPCHSSYYKFCDEKNLIDQQKFIQQLCQQYNFKYLNFFKDTRFVLEDFANADHLNFKGATKFSTILNDTLKK